MSAIAVKYELEGRKAYELTYSQRSTCRGFEVWKRQVACTTLSRERALNWAKIVDCSFTEIFVTNDQIVYCEDGPNNLA